MSGLELLTLVLGLLVATLLNVSDADGLETSSQQGLFLVTIATQENDGFRQYFRSTKKYGLKPLVFGMGKEWMGGDMSNGGGGKNVNILKEELKQFAHQDNLIIMFTDSYDAVLTAGAADILDKFNKMDARVVFSAKGFCEPDKSLANKYPEVKVHEKRFLCSGGFIGYAKDVYEIVSYKAIQDGDDDQLYYTNIFLDESLRTKWNIKLDKRSEIFMNLNGALGEIMLKFIGNHSYVYNVKTGTVPVVVHGNSPIKPEFNRIANYLADRWTTVGGCLVCDDDTISLAGLQKDDYPNILMGLFLEHPTPFLKEFLEKVAALDYPKSKIDFMIHNAFEFHQKDVMPFLLKHAALYKSVNILNFADNVDERNARNWAIEECIKMDCQYLFVLDGDVHLEDDQTLTLLIQQNRSVIAPMLTRRGKAWSNFWGALSDSGFYARSEDYMDIVNRQRIGLWNVPYMSGAYLIQSHVLASIRDGYLSSQGLDADMALCKTLRDKGHFMYVTNRHVLGYLINAEEFESNHKHNELYELFHNPYDWEKRYIHPNYLQSLMENAVIAQPCPDVFWFPMMTETFCDEMVEEMEYFGQWSGGRNDDPRLMGGYENVPTDDIHMTQVGLQDDWLEFLKIYIAPLATKVFPGYYSDPPRAILNFVVKYNPQRQRELRAHHDSSTFTINIALNNPNVDFEGGGCRFLRYNCSIKNTRKGWMLMHPGRLTHFHEGLPVTSGTRYIMVSFVDP